MFRLLSEPKILFVTKFKLDREASVKYAIQQHSFEDRLEIMLIISQQQILFVRESLKEKGPSKFNIHASYISARLSSLPEEGSLRSGDG